VYNYKKLILNPVKGRVNLKLASAIWSSCESRAKIKLKRILEELYSNCSFEQIGKDI